MKTFIYKSKHFLPVDIVTAWNFFSNPKNLREITPVWLNFRIINKLPDKMYAGLKIKYKVSPVLGIPLTWITEITLVNEPYLFIDEQLKGPYKLWRHMHTFEETNGGILMTDTVEYAVPFGKIFPFINNLFVSKKIEEIFTYRKKVLEEKFGKE
jgi:ligand-binding SRPBCC domain-containing protein